MAVPSRQAREQVLELRELHLRARLARSGVRGEDVEDDRGTVERPDPLPPLLEVPHLAGRELVVEDHESGAVLACRLFDLLLGCVRRAECNILSNGT